MVNKNVYSDNSSKTGSLFKKENITVNAYFFKKGKSQNFFRRHLEAETNRIYDGAGNTNQSTDGVVRQECACLLEIGQYGWILTTLGDDSPPPTHLITYILAHISGRKKPT